jgi:hypothetical protein
MSAGCYCLSCNWWTGGFIGLDDSQGECRRRSPVLSRGETAWPITHRSHWCGDWRPVSEQVRKELEEARKAKDATKDLDGSFSLK